ncbi:hypothetical protein RyT2_14300 [Pseudolactococcus yaeyamensis]
MNKIKKCDVEYCEWCKKEVDCKTVFVNVPDFYGWICCTHEEDEIY